MPWIIDKNSGIGQGKLTNRPGLVIRKTPGSEVRRDTPPQMPVYVREQIEILKKDIQDISGVFDSLKGEQQGSITAASAILALQEASQARIRLKIKLMENSLSELSQMVYSRMQQFWKLDRWVRVTDVEGNPMFKQIGIQVLQNDYDLKVMAGSTMPVNRNAMLDLMIRLAQTNGEDGLPLVDRKAVLEFLPSGDKKAITDRFAELQAKQEQQAQMQIDQQAQMQQQQKGELDQGVTEQVMNMLQQVIQASDITAKQVDELILDKENRDKKEYESKIEEKGYKRGIKDGKMQAEEKEEVASKDEEKKMLEEQLLSENAQMEEALSSQQIPNEVLEELLNLSKEDPQAFMEVLQAYPELAQMLEEDIQNLNGGLPNESL